MFRPIVKVIVVFAVCFLAFRFMPDRQMMLSAKMHRVSAQRPAIVSAVKSYSRKAPAAGEDVFHVWTLEDLKSTELPQFCESLKTADYNVADAIAHKPLRTFVDEFGMERQYVPGVALVKFKTASEVSLVRVQDGVEPEARKVLAGRQDVAFAELDAIMTRQFAPNDQFESNQWHHATIQSTNAWAISLGSQTVRVGILDTPFQMDHPDLAPNTAPGWDIVTSSPITRSSSSPYQFHSTISAGMAAATVNNFVGVSGAANATILPINMLGSLSEMYRAILWAADNNVRVMNISWDGAYSSTVNDAAAQHRAKVDGMVVMAGVNTRTFLNYPNQPYLYAVSATDSVDGSRTAYGKHIDFAAPGWSIYSTTTNSFYEFDSGSSYAAPLVSGIIAMLMSINPALHAEQIEQILINTAQDLGPIGWDQYFGWGRINFGRAAFAASSYSSLHVENSTSGALVWAEYLAGASYNFFKSSDLSRWEPVNPADTFKQDGKIYFAQPSGDSAAFFRLEAQLP